MASLRAPILFGDFMDDFAVARLTFIDLSHFEAISRSARDIVLRTEAWCKCADRELPMISLRSLLRSRIEQISFKQFLSRMRRVTILARSPVPLASIRLAEMLATSVSRAQRHAAAHLMSGNDLASTFVGVLDFADQGLVTNRELGLISPGGGEELAPWSVSNPLRCMWSTPGQQTKMVIRLGMCKDTLLLSARAQEVNTQSGAVVSSPKAAYAVDIHGVSTDIHLRTRYTIQRTNGRWIRGTGLFSRPAASQQPLEALLCVVYIRSMSQQEIATESQSTAHALNIECARRPAQVGL